MKIIWTLLAMYLVIYTVKNGFRQKLAFAVKVNGYALEHSDPKVYKRAQRKKRLLDVFKGAFRVVGWIEDALSILMLAWLVYAIVSLLMGNEVWGI